MNRNDWAMGWMKYAGIPLGPIDPVSGIAVNRIGIVTWINSEGSAAKNNPLDTEQPAQGATNYNSVGVKNYPTTEIGYDATLRTLNNGYYPVLRNVLYNPTTAENLISAIYWSVWGSKPTIQMLDNVRHNYPAFADVYVSGTGSSLPMPNPTPTPTTPPWEGNKKMWLIALTASGQGYWKCNVADGSVYAYGDALYEGGINNAGPNGSNALAPGDWVTGFSGHSNDGYVMVTNDGHDYAFGTAKYAG